MMTRYRMRFLLAGITLIVLTNAVALVGAVYNRTGTPEAVLKLSQRELALPYNWGLERENSGLALNLTWRTLGEDDEENLMPLSGGTGSPGWLNQQKLQDLGFVIPAMKAGIDADKRFIWFTAKEVLIVLELNGSAYQSSLEHARQRFTHQEALLAVNPGKEEFTHRVERARKNLISEEQDASRLFVVDAGLDQETLRGKYPDRNKYLILKGQVRPYLNTQRGKIRMIGEVETLSVESIHVPLEHKHILDLVRRAPQSDQSNVAPPYTVEVAFGQRLEPWIIGVSVNPESIQ